MNLTKWEETRELIWVRDGGVCQICHLPIDRSVYREYQVDHIHQRYLGGSDSMENLRATHRACNAARPEPEAERMIPLKHLRAWRQRRLLTLRELAGRAGVTYVTVFRIEHGQPARMSTARRLADALGITADELLAGPNP